MEGLKQQKQAVSNPHRLLQENRRKGICTEVFRACEKVGAWVDPFCPGGGEALAGHHPHRQDRPKVLALQTSTNLILPFPVTLLTSNEAMVTFLEKMKMERGQEEDGLLLFYSVFTVAF
jgi:hypothetical protein